MNNRFKQTSTTDLMEALKIFYQLSEEYEDVRLEKSLVLNTTWYYIEYRFPIK